MTRPKLVSRVKNAPTGNKRASRVELQRFGGYFFSLRHSNLLFCPEILESPQADITERGVQPPSVVERLQILEDGAPGGLPSREASTMGKLAFERGHERIRDSVASSGTLKL
jgi:hypothetical protein